MGYMFSCTFLPLCTKIPRWYIMQVYRASDISRPREFAYPGRILARTLVIELGLENYGYLSFYFPDRPIQLASNHLLLVAGQQSVSFAYYLLLGYLVI